MKIIKMTESVNDSKDLEVLMAEKKKVEDYLQLLGLLYINMMWAR